MDIILYQESYIHHTASIDISHSFCKFYCQIIFDTISKCIPVNTWLDISTTLSQDKLMDIWNLYVSVIVTEVLEDKVFTGNHRPLE